MASTPTRKRGRQRNNDSHTAIESHRKRGKSSKNSRTSFVLPQESPESQGKDLCKRCDKIDFTSIFHEQRPISHTNGRFITALEGLVIDGNCPACCLFEELVVGKRFGVPPICHLRAFSASKFFGANTPANRKLLQVALSVLPGGKKATVYEWMRQEYPDKGFILSRPAKEARPEVLPAVEATAVAADLVNYSQVETWLDYCSSSHNHICVEEEQSFTSNVPVQCIDCETRAVVGITSNNPYIALSYVWGTSSPFILNADGTLPPKVSQVVEDSLHVTKRLGHRYLWVDQYCVDQTNEEVKRLQIAEMARVYAGAYATIIAAAGPDANYGLAGVSRPRLREQRSIHLDRLTLFASMPTLSHALEESTWIRRGWTYQEAILSRRCIFFTDYQVYYACRDMTCREAVTVHLPRTRPRTYVRNGIETIGASIFQGEHRTLRGNHGRDFANHVTEYSSRNFTLEEDKLNAFRGLLSRELFFTFFGIPILLFEKQLDRAFDAAFALGLWWTSVNRRLDYQESLERIPQLPSWSWVGWKGSVRYPVEHDTGADNANGRFMEVDLSHTDVRFWVQDGKMNFSTFEEVIRTLQGRIIPEVSHVLCLEAWVVQLHFQQGARVGKPIICFCKCHLQSPHPGIVSDPEELSPPRPEFFEQLGPRHNGFQDIIGKSWDCVELFESTLGYQSLMIIEWDNDIAYRVGNVQINPEQRQKFAKLRRTWKRIMMK
ncbi:heterokaryon incompatibility protein-domain-containing protein [Paraphoma chrysanthemicola]|nr:heterokaryon incompatibility protein-domain-containing protein [Paraphoma chrysanthemicola]